MNLKYFVSLFNGMVRHLVSQLQGCRFESNLWSFCEERLSPGTLASSQTHADTSRHMHIRLVGKAELSVLVSVSEGGCLSLCVGPAIN